MADGYDCTCAAHSENECCCGADWTPQETYDLRDQLAASQQREAELVAHVERLREALEVFAKLNFAEAIEALAVTEKKNEHQ